jgi:hypothetical protein
MRKIPKKARTVLLSGYLLIAAGLAAAAAVGTAWAGEPAGVELGAGEPLGVELGP